MGAPQLNAFIRRLTGGRRVLVLGGMAVIAHGLSRTTKDADIWLEPGLTAEDWSEYLLQARDEFEGVTLAGLPGWYVLETPEDVATAARETGIVRVLGLEFPLDVFHKPNEIGVEDFDAMWERSVAQDDGSHLLDPIDLLISKEDTGRAIDLSDQVYLQQIIRAKMGPKLKEATAEEAERIFSRYCDHAVCASALENPDPAVRELATGLLRELAADGDPYARDLLERG